jgi:hypothetical protein
LRKELAYAVSDRVTLELFGDDVVREAVNRHRDWIADEVLALEVRVAPADEGSEVTHSEQNRATHRFDLDGQNVTVAITRIG